MSQTISIRCEPMTGRKTGGQRRHDLRDPAHVPDYVDRNRTAENSVLIEPPTPEALRADIEEGRKAAGQQRLRADARTAIAGIITWGTEAQEIVQKLPREEQDALYQRIAARVSKETGHDLIGLVVHRDESAPHAHVLLRGYRRDEQGRELPWRHGRDMMRRLQDVAAEEVKHLGIERGTPKAERIARGDDAAQVVHRSVRELHRDLPRELEARRAELEAHEQEAAERLAKLQAEIAEQQERAEKQRRLIEEQHRKLEAGRVEEEKAAKRIQTYERREAEAQAKVQEMEARARELEARLGLLGDAADVADRIARLREQEERMQLPPPLTSVAVAVIGEHRVRMWESGRGPVIELSDKNGRETRLPGVNRVTANGQIVIGARFDDIDVGITRGANTPFACVIAPVGTPPSSYRAVPMETVIERERQPERKAPAPSKQKKGCEL